MYVTAASIALFILFLIQAVQPLAIRQAGDDRPVLRRSSRNNPIRSLNPTSDKTHNSEKTKLQHETRESASLRTNQNQGTSEEIRATHDPVPIIVAISTPPKANTETNVLLHPRKRDNTGGNSGCCSGDSVSVSTHISCNCVPPCSE